MLASGARAGAPRLNFVVAILAIAWIGFVSHKAETYDDAIYPILLLAFGIIPTLIWIARWRDTLPIMPIYGLVNVLHFGLPFTSSTSDVLNYSEAEKLAGTLMVCGFLVAATFAWVVVMGFVRIQPKPAKSFDAAPIGEFLPYGFGIAALFNWAEMTGAGYVLGNGLPVARAVCGSIFFICAYLLGALWAEGVLSARLKVLCSILFALGAMITWSSLYLYPSMFVIAMFFIGYMISARRVPVALVAAVFSVFVVLQAGKSTMRGFYQDELAVTSILEMPAFVAEWVGEGILGLATQADQEAVQLGDRIGLMHMLLRAQTMTPSQVDFLNGETYSLIPRLMIPRFLDPDKPIAHAGLIMLNVRYGLLVLEEVDQTSIGWGMLPEAYANFGDIGVIGLGVLVGALFAAVTLWTSGAPALSGRAMFGVMMLLTSFNLEADTAVFLTTLVQGAVAIFAINVFFGIFGQRSRRGGGGSHGH